MPLGFAIAQAFVLRHIVVAPLVVEISGLSCLAAWQMFAGWLLASCVGAPSCAIACQKVVGKLSVLSHLGCLE